MTNDNVHPIHLQPFMDGTPLALERMRSAWPGLLLADRVYLLSVLLSDRNSHPSALIWKRQHEALIDLALQDENAYIRYLAAKRVPAPNKRDGPGARARIEKVRADSSHLVRSAQLEVGTVSPSFKLSGQGPLMGAVSPKYDPALFWTCHPVYRLAVATQLSWDFSVSGFLRYATTELLPNGAVTENEMADVLLQYLGPDYVRRFSKKEPRAHCSSYHFNNEVDELWKLVPDVPEQLAGILLQCLPGGDKQSPIPSGILESLDDEGLAFLLRRDDVELNELRRRLYIESSNEKLRRAAVAGVRFELLDSDISHLVSDNNRHEEPRDKKVEELFFLAKYCRGASLIQMEAVHHYLCGWGSDYYRTDAGDALQSERAKRLWNDGVGRFALEAELLQLRIFELAKSLSPMDSDEEPSQLPKSLQHHLKLISPQNPWQTYLNLWSAVRLVEWKGKREDLPEVWIRDFRLPDLDDLEANGR
jgi:hypothetical protein